MTDLLTSAEAAARLRICERSLRKLRKAGLIRYIAKGERGVLYRDADCEEYLASRERRDEPCQLPAKTPQPRAKAGRIVGNIIPFSERRQARGR